MASECRLYTKDIIPRKLPSNLKLLSLHSGLWILIEKAVVLNTCRIVRKF